MGRNEKIEFSPNQVSLFGIQLQNRIKNYNENIKNKYAQTIDDCFDMEDHSDENSDN